MILLNLKKNKRKMKQISPIDKKSKLDYGFIYSIRESIDWRIYLLRMEKSSLNNFDDRNSATVYNLELTESILAEDSSLIDIDNLDERILVPSENESCRFDAVEEQVEMLEDDLIDSSVTGSRREH